MRDLETVLSRRLRCEERADGDDGDVRKNRDRLLTAGGFQLALEPLRLLGLERRNEPSLAAGHAVEHDEFPAALLEAVKLLLHLELIERQRAAILDSRFDDILRAR